MKDFAAAFYKSRAWNKTRKAYMNKAGGLCEECLKVGIYTPGEIVHHKIHITPENIRDAKITLNFDNLELLCRDCHAKKHSNGGQIPYKFDCNGNLIKK